MRILTVTVLITLAGAAHAGSSLFTPLLAQGAASTLLFCEAVNVSAKPIAQLTVSVISVVGDPTKTQTCTNLAQGQICFANGPTAAGYCQVDGGTKKTVRASLEVRDASNNILATLPAN